MSWIAFFRKLNINFTRRYCSHFYLHYSIFSNSFLVHIYHILVHIYPFLPYSIFSNLFTTPLCISPISHSSIFISFAYYSILDLFASHLFAAYLFASHLFAAYWTLWRNVFCESLWNRARSSSLCVEECTPPPVYANYVYANYVYANYVYNVSWLSQVQITALSITPLLCCNLWASQ